MEKLEFFRNIIAWLLEPFYLTNRTNLKASLACLLFAVIFWFFNELGQQHNVKMLYTVDFEHKIHKHTQTDFKKNLSTENNRNIEIAVEGTGWRILHEQLRTQYMWKETIIYPLSRQNNQQNSQQNAQQDSTNSKRKYVLSNAFRPFLAEKFTDKLKIIQIRLDTFYLD